MPPDGLLELLDAGAVVVELDDGTLMVVLMLAELGVPLNDRVDDGAGLLIVTFGAVFVLAALL